MSLRHLCLVSKNNCERDEKRIWRSSSPWEKSPTPAAADALLRIEKGAKDKDLKKEIRRSLFKLSQKGLTIPQATRVEEKPPTPMLSRSPEIEAYMSPVDGSGGRLVWIVKPQAGHGLQTIQAMINDREGLQRIGGTQVRRKELRNMAQEIKKQHGVTMISVPWEYADRMLYESFEKAKAAGRSGLENFHAASVDREHGETQRRRIIPSIEGSIPQRFGKELGESCHGDYSMSRSFASGF